MIQVNDSAIIIETEKFIKVLSIRNILFIRADECYSEINTSAGKKILISKTLKETQSYFPDKHFFRCHKSYLINMQYFKELKKKSKDRMIVLTNDDSVPVSQRKFLSFKEDLKEYVCGKLKLAAIN